MDDLTAIRYLSTCRFLHAGYHAYPLKQAMSMGAFRESTQLDAYFRQMGRVWYPINLQPGLCLGLVLWSQRRVSMAVPIVLAILLALCWGRIAWLKLVHRRADCCVRGRWGMWSRWKEFPRVRRLVADTWSDKLSPYLQHLTELTITHHSSSEKKGRALPLSVRTLHLHSDADLILTPGMLPPRLTSLSLGTLDCQTVAAGVLPPTLTSLHLTYGFSSTFDSKALPAQLQRLRVDDWTLQLSHAVLPASLTSLDVRFLWNHPLPVLPPRLRVLRISGMYQEPRPLSATSSPSRLRVHGSLNSTLVGALPASLRVFRLDCPLDVPVTADVFACTPQLEELSLPHCFRVTPLIAAELPRTLRALRVGVRYEVVVQQGSDLPPGLQRLVVPTQWSTENVAAMQRFAQRHGLQLTIKQVE